MQTRHDEGHPDVTLAARPCNPSPAASATSPSPAWPSSRAAAANPLAPKPPHFTPRAKRVIFIFMQGGPSHVDSFDYKPRLERDDGQMLTFDDARTLARTRTRRRSIAS